MYPFPSRSTDPRGQEPDVKEVGWDRGTLSDGRPYLAECWAQDGMTVVTVFFSTRDLDELDDQAAARLLGDEDLVRYLTDPKVTARRWIEHAGEPMWTVSVIIGLEYFLFAEDAFRFQSYPREAADE